MKYLQNTHDELMDYVGNACEMCSEYVHNMFVACMEHSMEHVWNE